MASLRMRARKSKSFKEGGGIAPMWARKSKIALRGEVALDNMPFEVADSGALANFCVHWSRGTNYQLEDISAHH